MGDNKDDKPKRDRPWIFRTYAGHSTAAKSNALYRQNLAKGQTGLSIAFDLPTQTGYDSDHPLAAGEVGKVVLARDLAGSIPPGSDLRRLVRALAAHGVEGVDQSEHAAHQRDLEAAAPAGIAGAVVALVVVLDHLEDLDVADPGLVQLLEA